MSLSREQVRSLDRIAEESLGVPGVVLMENAGRRTADRLLNRGVRGRVVVCCGRGNNGGDGLVAARHLDAHGVPTSIVLYARPADLRGDAALNYRIVERSELPVIVQVNAAVAGPDWAAPLAGAEWVVDALFGTGLSGTVKPPFDAVIEAINGCGARILAVDIPSGLDCDTGLPLGVAVRATETVSLVAAKKGFDNPAARQWLGEVVIADIGIPGRLLRHYGLSA